MLKQLWSCRRAAVEAVVHWSGLGLAFEAVAQPTGAIILMYHSIAPDNVAEFVDPPNRLSPEQFGKQMAFLNEHRRVVPLSQVVDQIASGVTPSVGTVCITFDDGYLDNLTIASPILEKYNFPATLFLATGYVERGESQWADTLHWTFRHRTSDSLQIPLLGIQTTNLRSEAARAVILKKIHAYLLEATYLRRKELLNEINRQLMPEGKVPRLTLNWDDVRALCRKYPFFEIGGHTRDHIDLQKHRGELAHAEIDGCSEDIWRELGVRPRHFSFPYGRWCDETRQIVHASNWQSAVGINIKTRVDNTIDKFSIPRVEAPRTMTDLRFKTSGAYPGFFSMLGLK